MVLLCIRRSPEWENNHVMVYTKYLIGVVCWLLLLSEASAEQQWVTYAIWEKHGHKAHEVCG